MSGVRISAGSVIAARSVVTRDVPPYAIVAGNPARVVKYRFDEPTIDILLRLRWWDLNDHELNTVVPLLMQAPGRDLIEKLQVISSAAK
jgi:carbonic anhydrase/acetyltransferase-like protein (isoleucine patch superfamily)